MTDTPNFTPIRQSLLEKIEAGKLPSMAVAVARRGVILWDEALGWADRELRTPASPATIYPLASVSKSISATRLMILAERGQIDLDASLARYLAPGDFPASPYPLEQATVRQVVNVENSHFLSDLGNLSIFLFMNMVTM